MCNSDNCLKTKYNFSQIERETNFIIDSNGYIQFIEPSITNILGYTQEELINKNYLDFLFTKNKSGFSFNLPYYSKNIELKLLHKEGFSVRVSVILDYIYNSRNQLIEAYGTLLDISKIKNSESDYNILNRLVNNSKDVLYRYSVAEQRFIYLSKSIYQLFGFKVEEFLNDKTFIHKVVHPDDINNLLNWSDINLDYSKPIISRWLHKNGYYVWIEDYATPFYDEDGNLLYVDGAYRDITEKMELEKRLRYLTYHDALTGLFNRNYFEEEISKLNTDINVPVALILCDMDNLKIVNDSKGHDNGDQMIIQFCRILATMIDNNSFAARIGGDEFVIVLKAESSLKTKNIVESMTVQINEYNKHSNDFKINISIGSAFCEHSLGNMRILFKKADYNMYRNKSIRKSL